MGFLDFIYRCLTLVILALVPVMSSFAQGKDGTAYERSSIHIMMIKHLNQRYEDLIEKVFMQTPFPERFNNHNLGVKVVSFAELEEDQSSNIQSFVEQVGLGQKMVAKWFCRDKSSGSFSMNLIKERGLYNAKQANVNLARASIRGLSLLEDAGENLIHNTYLVVNDISYRSKGSGNWFLKAIGSVYSGNASKIQKDLESIGGFNVYITTYLFRLKWNDAIANTFYKDFYTENGSKDAEKVNAFRLAKNLFQLEYVGKTYSESSESNFKACNDPMALLVKVTTRTMDKNIALLQHSYPDFRIKAPLISVNPLKADVGLKEDVSEKSQFEVLEQVVDDKGKLTYERVGVIRPVKNKIKDNRYLASDENSMSIDATEFEKVSGRDFFPGMLIREI